MGARRLMNGLAVRGPRRTPVSRRARRSARPLTVAAGGALAIGLLAVPAAAGPTAGVPVISAAPGRAATTCALGANGSSIQHVIYIQFDNVHFTRDNPNVPSDLE